MQKKHRVFVAINLPPEVRRALGKYMEKWKDLPAKWADLENLHITVSFLGDLTDVELAEACTIAKEVISQYKAFSLKLDKISYGPESVPIPKFVWVKGEKIADMVALKDELEVRLAERIPFTPDNRGFLPHITLARISSMAFRSLELEERPEINEAVDLEFEVETIEIMQAAEGKYETVESIELGND